MYASCVNMMRPIAVRKASATVAGARGGMVAGRAAGAAAGAALGSVVPVVGTAIGGFIGGALGGAAGGAIGGAGGAAVDAGKAAKTVGVKTAGAAKTLGSKGLQAGKEMATGQVGDFNAKTTAGLMAQQASANHAAQQQQTKQNNLEAAQNVADKAKEAGEVTKSVFVKAGIEVHHQDPLPEDFTQDITTLDRNHQMSPTENGTMIDNISPHMLRTIELMAQNHKDDERSEPKPFVMPTLRH